MGKAGWLAGVCMAVMLPLVAAAQTDPGDLVFWQSVQNSKNPAEYRAYLEAYPNGRFAALARARLADVGGGATPAPAPTPPPTAGGTDDADEYTVSVTPPGGRVGQTFTVNCTSLPPGSYDKVVVVPAGTPVLDPRRSPDETKVLWQTYTNQCGNGMKAGPFAPGAYEVRWMTILFNNESRFESKAKATFTVR